MNATKIFAAMLFAVFVFAVSTFGGLFESPIERSQRESSERMWSGARDQLRQQILEFNQQIAEARAKFWETYPDKPGAAEAQQRFSDLLRQKDVYSLTVVLSHGMADLGGVGVQMDEGIRKSAGPEFEDLVNAARKGVGGSDMMGWVRSMLVAIDANPKEYKAYVLERDWWEFDHVQRVPTGCDKPETYGSCLYHRFGKLPGEEAGAIYNAMVELLGKQLVYDAAKKVMDAPKEASGNLVVTVPPPLKRGPGGSQVDDDDVPMPEGVIGVYRNPEVALEVLATKDDDRRYLLYLLKGQYVREYRSLAPNKWAFAAMMYDRLKIAFGEKELLETARLVRTAKKRMTSGDVMDPKAIGATRGVPFSTFEDILARKNATGYVRAALIFNEKLKTPAEVDAAYKELVSTSDEDEVLDAAKKMAAKKPNLIYRDELRYLKEALDNPETAEEPAPTLVDFPEYVAWKKFAPGAKVSYADRIWQLARPDSDRLVPGAVEYHHAYLLKSINDEQAQLWFTETSYNRSGTALPSRDTEIAYPAKYAQPATPAAAPAQSSAETTAAPRGKGSAAGMSQAAASRMRRTTTTTAAVALVPGGYHPNMITPASGPTESGEETLEINGKRIATRWQSVSYLFEASSPDKDCSLVVKVWTSDQVPTGLVRKTEDKICPADRQHPYPRVVKETYLDSFEGFTPAVPDSSQPVSTTYVPPPVVLKRAVAATAVTPNPATTPAPPKPAPQQTPVPARTPPPRNVSRPALPPDVAAQMELSQRYSKAVVRAAQAKNKLAQLERKQAGQGTQLPADVRDARDRIESEMKAVMIAMSKRDNDQTNQSLQTLEDTVSVIEKYLKQ